MSGAKRKSEGLAEGGSGKLARNKFDAKLLQNLKHEASCSVCLEIFNDPVTIDCGHNFCQACITRYWEEYDRNFPCPQCRTKSNGKNLRPNRELSNIAEITSQLHMPKDMLQSALRELRQEAETLMGLKAKDENDATELEDKFKNQWERRVDEFEDLRRYLKEEKRRLLASLKKEQEEILKKIWDKVGVLEEHHSSIMDLVTEIEGKRQKSEVELMKDIQNTLSRCKAAKAERSEAVAIDQERILRIFSTQHADLQKLFLNFKETFPLDIEWRRTLSYAENVTLDPDTAHLSLILADGRKSVRIGARQQKLPERPERFSDHLFVLGSQGYSSGKHYWEVEVGDKSSWVLGVCNDNVPRKARTDVSPENGYWGIFFLNSNAYGALTIPPTPFTPKVNPQAVGVFLDYEEGRVTFYNVEARTQIYAFPPCMFTRTLLPFLSPDLDGTMNSGALKIRIVMGQ